MRIVRKEYIQKPFINPSGERIYEMIGRQESLGGAKAHSFAHVVIPYGGSSRHHYHPKAEETYYLLAGQARLIINDKEYFLTCGDAVFIMPSERHQIFSIGETDLEFIVICAPAWEPDNSVYLDEQ